jgi:hypothetical protein
MTKLAVVLSLLVPACITGNADEPELSEVEQHQTTTVNNYCYTQGSTTWCQDYYTAKWCSSKDMTWAYGYDYTGCNWSGWNNDGYYCTNGYQWDSHTTHRHC